MTTQPSSILETICCPLCENTAFEVIKPSKYPATISEEMLRETYSASSSHELVDQLVRCTACSMHYVNPRPRQDLITDSYAAGEDPTFIMQNNMRVRTFHRIFRKVIRHGHISPAQGKTLLDIGCAGGASLVAAGALGFDATGVEPNGWMANYARQTYGVRVFEGLLKPGMFEPKSFDVITILDVLEHAPDPKAVLDLIRELLRPEGTLILSYPDFRSTMGKILGDSWPFWLSVHLLYYDRKTIAQQFIRSGFEALEYMPYWATLDFGYVLQRATPYVPFLRPIHRMLDGSRLGRTALTYNIGQRIVVAKIKK